MSRRLIGRLVPITTDAFSGPVHVRVEGPADGTPIVLLHGFSGSMRWWDRVAPLLADTYRVVRLDLLGHGFTGGAAADAPVQARVVEAVLASLDVEGATVVGHSFGADVAVELAEWSARVDALVIVCQAPDYEQANLPAAKVLMTLPVVSTGLHRFAVRLGTVLSRVAGAVGGYPIGPELAELGLLDFGVVATDMFRVILIERRDRMARRPLDAQVRAAGKRTLAVVGGRDHFYGDRYVERYRAAGAEVVVLPESGHSPLVEQPGQTARLIRDFVGVPAPAP